MSGHLPAWDVQASVGLEATMSFAANVGALRNFFGTAAEVSLADAVTQMNDAMGLANVGKLPDQVERLMDATGLTKAGDDAPAGASDQSKGSDLHTSLPGIGMSADPKLANSLSKWKARDLSAPPPDERKQKIFEYQEKLRTPQPDDGVSTIMPSGGKSTTPSMLTCPEGTDPAEFGPFKNVATFMAASPPLRQYAPSAKALASDFRLC